MLLKSTYITKLLFFYHSLCLSIYLSVWKLYMWICIYLSIYLSIYSLGSLNIKIYIFEISSQSSYILWQSNFIFDALLWFSGGWRKGKKVLSDKCLFDISLNRVSDKTWIYEYIQWFIDTYKFACIQYIFLYKGIILSI